LSGGGWAILSSRGTGRRRSSGHHATHFRVAGRPAGVSPLRTSRTGAAMKKLLEIILCFLHPLAVVLIWINLLGRTDIGMVSKLSWGIAAIVPFVPFLYVFTGNDFI
jgi:hypothetical protein